VLWAFRCDPGRRLHAAIIASSTVIMFFLLHGFQLHTYCRQRAAFKYFCCTIIASSSQSITATIYSIKIITDGKKYRMRIFAGSDVIEIK
jgi:hypothetical protein